MIAQISRENYKFKSKKHSSWGEVCELKLGF